jgi:hypothetical protein
VLSIRRVLFLERLSTRNMEGTYATARLSHEPLYDLVNLRVRVRVDPSWKPCKLELLYSKFPLGKCRKDVRSKL